MNNFNESLDFLKKSPVFAMSLGSKELFHSNLWGWIMDQDYGKSLISFFFPDFDLNKFERVEREDRHRDLVIYDIDGNEYVIENKIKSLPDKGQLDKYSPSCKRGVVTGILKPSFDLGEKWRFVSYMDLLKGLHEVIEKAPGIYTVNLLEEYLQMIYHINYTLDYCMEKTTGILSFWDDDIKLLSNIRMLDVFRKLKASDFIDRCNYLYEIIPPKLKDMRGWRFNISNTFHNGKATISFELIKDKPKYIGQIGIQIEDNQFRLFYGNRYKKINDLFEKGKQVGWFDDSFDKKHNRAIFSHFTKMSKNPCSYNGDWVYQYFEIWSDQENLQSYEVLKQLIDNYLDKAISIIKEEDKSMFCK